MQEPELTVLAIDDKGDNLIAVNALLTEAFPAVHVLTATTGPVGLDLAAAEDPDVILLDVLMPGMDGFEVCRRLKNDPRTKDIPVVFLTALRTTREHRIKALKNGAEAFLTKPIDEVELAAQVRAMAKIKAANVQNRNETERLNALVAERTHDLEQSRMAALGLLDKLRTENEKRKDVQAQLVEAGALHRQILTNINEGVIVYDRDLRYRVWNPYMESLTGYPASKVLGKLPLDVFPFLDKFGVMSRLESALLGEESTPISFPLQIGNRTVWGRNNSSPLRNDDGEIIGVIATVQDITEQRRTDDALRESEERFRRAVVYSPIPVMIHAEDGHILQASDSWCDITGYTRDELTTIRKWTDLAYGESMNTMREHIDDLYALDGPKSEGVSTVRIKSGALRSWSFSSAPLGRGSDGRRLVITVANDVTERVQAEEQREKLEEQLRASQRLEAIGVLAGGVAHDFNNLLSVILSFTGFAIDELNEGDPMHEDLTEVKNAAERGAALTRQLLAFSRKQVLQPEILDLNETATGLEKMLRRILGEDIEFRQSLASDLGVVHADPGQVEQVMMNLVVNARDAMPEGGTLTIATSNVEIDDENTSGHTDLTPGAYVEFAITDTGTGMDEETKARIFEPFFTTKEKGKGTGLGLSTVYGIVKQSGGAIQVFSEPGRGTTFKVQFPRELTGARPSIASSATVMTRLTGRETILVAEDEHALRKVAKKCLESCGYTVLAAASGDEALDMAAECSGEIDLLLTDVVMPRMGGRVLAEELLKLRPTLEVLYMSGYTDDTILHHGVLTDGTHFIAKPFSGNELARKVHEVLDDAARRATDTHE